MPLAGTVPAHRSVCDWENRSKRRRSEPAQPLLEASVGFRLAVDLTVQGLGACRRAQRARSRWSRARRSLEGPFVTRIAWSSHHKEPLTWLGNPHPDLLFIPNEIEAGRGTITLLVYMAHRFELEARLEMAWPAQARTAKA